MKIIGRNATESEHSQCVEEREREKKNENERSVSLTRGKKSEFQSS